MFFCLFFQPLLGRLPCLRITPSRFAHKVFALGMCIVLRSRNVCTYEMPCKALTCLPLCAGSMSSASDAPLPLPASPATPRRSPRLAGRSEEEKNALHDAPTSPVLAPEPVPGPQPSPAPAPAPQASPSPAPAPPPSHPCSAAIFGPSDLRPPTQHDWAKLLAADPELHPGDLQYRLDAQQTKSLAAMLEKALASDASPTRTKLVKDFIKEFFTRHVPPVAVRVAALALFPDAPLVNAHAMVVPPLRRR